MDRLQTAQRLAKKAIQSNINQLRREREERLKRKYDEKPYKH